ncbi:hypothetical protein ABT095_17440 [Kitasatospora sp. NPDC002227]|uniref:hypothetical protein n=1 Tax=Kitasatospora sp. NPDC002227 TaxID=3154773 RepID=UPI0033179AC2
MSVTLLGALVVGVAGSLRVVLSLDGQPPADIAGLGLYLDVSVLWAAGSVLAVAARHASARRMAGWVVAMLLALLWPVQAALFAGLAARRAIGWRRVSTAVAGALLLVGGLGWGVTAYAAEQPWTGRSDTELLGTWQAGQGRTLDLHADHTFTAHGLTGYTPDTNTVGWWPFWHPDTTGTWELTAGQLVAVPHQSGLRYGTDADAALSLSPRGWFSPASLCLSPADPLQYCVAALHRP